MASQLRSDPFDMWRQALSKLENGMNALSNRSMNSDQFTQALQQFSTVALGMQHALDKALRRHFKVLNLPTRDDIEGLSAALQRIEERLDRLAGQPAPAGPRPARTRRPPEMAAPAAAAGTESARKRRVSAVRRKGAST
jgi:hypothetical protein